MRFIIGFVLAFSLGCGKAELEVTKTAVSEITCPSDMTILEPISGFLAECIDTEKREAENLPVTFDVCFSNRRTLCPFLSYEHAAKVGFPLAGEALYVSESPPSNFAYYNPTNPEESGVAPTGTPHPDPVEFYCCSR